MNNQCVPSWDLDDPVGAGINPVSAEAHRVASDAGAFTPVVVPMSDQYYEVAELTWQKGNISSQGLFNRPMPKYPPAPSQLHAIGSSSCVGGGGLEAVVGEAAARSSHLAHHPVASAPWIGVGVAAVAARAPADRVVPCARDEAEGEARRKRARLVGEDGLLCASQGSAAPGRGESTLITLEVCGTATDDVCGFTTTTNNSTSLEREDQGSPETENTSIGGGGSDSRCFSRRSQSQRDGLCDEDDNVVVKGNAAMRSSVSTKRSRAAAIHNESERKRRDRINQKMQTLQKLVPNSSKTDKASMLDEVIDHLKQLQAQVQMMSRMSSMMMPMAMPQLQMSVMANMAQMAQMAQMGLGMMNMSPLAHPGYAGLTPPMNMMHPPPAFVPMSWDAASAAAERAKQPAGSAAPDAYSAFLACQAAQQQNAPQQQQPNGMEAYNRMVAMYQSLSQQQIQLGKTKQ